MTGGRKPQPGDPRLPASFWRKVSTANSDCWIWTASRSAEGYGRLRHRRKSWQAHRMAYVALAGPIQPGMCLDHLCRNRACVNPAHLDVVTWRENTLRGDTRAARFAARTHCDNGHPFSGSNLLIRGNGTRRCRACKNANMRRYAARKVVR